MLAVYPRTTGFAYAVVEGRKRLVDWGQLKLGVNTDEEFRLRLEELIVGPNSPTMMVLEDCSNTRRGERTRSRIETALGAAQSFNLETLLISPAEVRVALQLPTDASKHVLVERVIELFPELLHSKPNRRIWQHDPRMYVFEAVTLCLAAE